MADTSNEKSGSRWEPDDSEHLTEDLTPASETEVIPGMAQEAPAPKRRIPKAAAAVAIVAAATIAGGGIGLALAGNSAQPVSDTAVSGEPTAGANQGEGTTPDNDGLLPSRGDHDGDGYGPGGHFGHHGPGGHR